MKKLTQFFKKVKLNIGVTLEMPYTDGKLLLRAKTIGARHLFMLSLTFFLKNWVSWATFFLLV